MTINCFGDSITVGTGTGAAIWYSQILGSLLNTSSNNYGINGSQLADDIAAIFSNSVCDSFLLTGFNDMRYYGAPPADFEQILQSAIVWIASGNKIKGQDPTAWTFTGNWGAAGAYGGAMTKYTSDNGATMSCTITGSVLYLSYTKINTGVGGSFNLTIDGVDYGTFNCFGNTATYSNLGYNPCLIRIPGLSNTAHTVVITNLTSKDIFIDYIASNYAYGRVLVLGGCLTCTPYNYTLGAPAPYFQNGSDINAALFSNIISNNASLFAGDGFLVGYAPINYNPNTQSVSGNVHPTTFGQCAIAFGFLNEYLSVA
jgi:hypothetical protein